MSDEKDEKKKDLTSILELSSLLPPASAEELLAADPFQVNTEQSVEQIADFADLGEMGMMDHVLEPEAAAEPALQDFSEHVPSDESITPLDPVEPLESAESLDTPLAHEDFPVESAPHFLEADFNDGDASSSGQSPFEPSSLPQPRVEEIKNYSERSLETSFRTREKTPFHLWMNGTFDPFARDKLLIFINENPIGLNSMELDRQINASRVMFPRISEFAGIKLIQDLRDADLTFKLMPSPRDEDETLPEAESARISFDAKTKTAPEPSILVLPNEKIDEKLWRAFDTIHLVQFLKAEILEVERSELFQNLMDRMLVSLKRKAELKGATAIGEVAHELKTLRLPSQYQVELSCTLYKKI